MAPASTSPFTTSVTVPNSTPSRPPNSAYPPDDVGAMRCTVAGNARSSNRFKVRESVAPRRTFARASASRLKSIRTGRARKVPALSGPASSVPASWGPDSARLTWWNTPDCSTDADSTARRASGAMAPTRRAQTWLRSMCRVCPTVGTAPPRSGGRGDDGVDPRRDAPETETPTGNPKSPTGSTAGRCGSSARRR